MSHSFSALRPVISVAAAASVLFLGACSDSFGIRGDAVPQADYYAARASARVYALDPSATGLSRFEVKPMLGSEAEYYWCAASEYARRVKGAEWTDKIYVERGRGPGERSALRETVGFSLAPIERSEPKPLFTRSFVFTPGKAYSVTRAHAACHDIMWNFWPD